MKTICKKVGLENGWAGNQSVNPALFLIQISNLFFPFRYSNHIGYEEDKSMLSLLADPVVWGSLLGIFIMIVMMAYYGYMFIHNSADPNK